MGGDNVIGKEGAARRGVAYVQSGMTIGLGTGSTAVFAIQALSERIVNEGLRVTGVPTSARSRALAEQLGVPLADFSQVHELDLTIDGADEVDANLNLIKGGGGALVQEKIVAAASRQLLIICDASKVKTQLGTFPLPVAVIPFGWESTQAHLAALVPQITLRLNPDGTPYLTDDHLLILDLHTGLIADPPAFEQRLRTIPGIAQVGLFCGMTSRLIVCDENGAITERTV